MKYLILFILLIQHFICFASPCSDVFVNSAGKGDQMSYVGARDFSRSLELSKTTDFLELMVQEREIFPENFPSRPKVFYESTGEWKGWEDFLGLKNNRVEYRRNPFSSYYYRRVVLKDRESAFTKDLAVIDTSDVVYRIEKNGFIEVSGVIEEKSKEVEEKAGVLNMFGDVKKYYKGQGGYLRYADTLYDRDMGKAYDEVESILLKQEMGLLGWMKYNGTTRAYIRSRLVDDNEHMNRRYIDQQGHLLYAQKFHNGNRLDAYRAVGSVLSQREMDLLNWKMYEDIVQNYEKETETDHSSVQKDISEEKTSSVLDRAPPIQRETTVLNLMSVQGNSDPLVYIGFVELQEYVQQQSIRSQKQYREMHRTGNLRSDVPYSPDRVYSDKGWKGWKDFLYRVLLNKPIKFIPPQAMYKLGKIYLHGNGVTQSYKEAIKWFLLAAQKENYEAMYELGEIYLHGNGVTQNYKEAIKWFLLAAQKENYEAMYELGEIYSYGIGVPKNHEKALEWFSRAILAEAYQAR